MKNKLQPNANKRREWILPNIDSWTTYGTAIENIKCGDVLEINYATSEVRRAKNNTEPEKQKPSEIIKENASKKEDWSDPCGAHNCKCYEHELLLEAILEYLDIQKIV